MVTTVVCTTPPHTADPKPGHTRQIQDYLSERSAQTDGSNTGLLPSTTQFPLAGPQRLPTGSSKEHKTPSRPATPHILHAKRTTSYRNGRPRPTRMEDHILHRWRTATEKLILLKLITLNESCVVFSLYRCSVQGLEHTNASVYGGVCSLLPLHRFMR